MLKKKWRKIEKTDISLSAEIFTSTHFYPTCIWVADLHADR